MSRTALVAALVFCLGGIAVAAEPAGLRIATFEVDATPPIGSPLCFGFVPAAKEIVDPLTARGVVLLGAGRPIVLCVIDWVEIGNASHDAWRQALAEAAGTPVDYVTVHTVHQHDAPGSDFGAEELLKQAGLGGVMENESFNRQVISRAAEALHDSLDHARRINQVGLGSAKVEKVASNRRILGPDGKVKIVRYSSSREAEAIAAPEGTIDPQVRVVSFWDNNTPVAVLSFYATHPQSYYGQGGVSADFVGMARRLFERSLAGSPSCLHFNGAAGNIAAGKYNNGDRSVRPILAERLGHGMQEAWNSMKRYPISVDDVRWSARAVALPLRAGLGESGLAAVLKNSKADKLQRVRAAIDLSYARGIGGGRKINVSMLRIGPARLLYLPGELFIEYQLAAQAMRPKDFVAMAAYGDCGPGYIGTEIAYSQGGYETGPVSRTAPQVEEVLMQAMRDLLAND